MARLGTVRPFAEKSALRHWKLCLSAGLFGDQMWLGLAGSGMVGPGEVGQDMVGQGLAT